MKNKIFKTASCLLLIGILVIPIIGNTVLNSATHGGITTLGFEHPEQGE